MGQLCACPGATPESCGYTGYKSIAKLGDTTIQGVLLPVVPDLSELANTHDAGVVTVETLPGTSEPFEAEQPRMPAVEPLSRGLGVPAYEQEEKLAPADPEVNADPCQATSRFVDFPEPSCHSARSTTSSAVVVKAADSVPSLTLTFCSKRQPAKTVVLESLPLGIEFTRRAPLRIARLRPGTYLKSFGLEVGMVLQKIDGAEVSRMKADTALKLLEFHAHRLCNENQDTG